MKVTYEGASVEEIQQLLALSQVQSGEVLTKEFFMVAMQDLQQKISDDKAAVIAYITKRDEQDVALQATLKDQASKIVSDEAELAALHEQIDATFATAKEIGDAVNPPPVVVPVDTSGNDASAGGTDSTAGSDSTAGTGDVGAGQNPA